MGYPVPQGSVGSNPTARTTASTVQVNWDSKGTAYKDQNVFSIMSKLLYQESADLLLSEFMQVRKKTMQLFKPLRIEDAVTQSDPFGSPPNWHIAHVTWFFQKVLEKHGAKPESDNNDNNNNNGRSGFNLEYLNSYYQQFGKILPKQERGKFPRPTVKQTLDYRSFIDKEVNKFLKESWPTTPSENASTMSHQLEYDIILGMQHEMQHQE